MGAYGGLIFLGAVALLGIWLFRSSFKVIGQAEVMVIERLGRFNRIARSGLNILLPIIEQPRSIDVRYYESDVSGIKRITAASTVRIHLREQVLNFPSQPVITKDNVTIDIDAVLYYRVADPQKATYAVQNLPFALETLTRTTLRNIVGDGTRLHAREPRSDQQADARDHRGGLDRLGRGCHARRAPGDRTAA